jgi:hypothetical protein
MCKLLPLLVASFLLSCGATGAFGTLWLLDLRREPDFPGSELFTTEHPSYGRNMFTMIASHASQHWFEVYGVYVEDPDAIEDPSDIYVRRYRGERTLEFIGYFSFILMMSKLLPMFAKGLVPWHEMVVQSNDYGNELGCRVSVRSYLEPMVWWVRVGSELSIRAGDMMFKNFKTIKLPRLLLGNEWNYASWCPYLAWGPRYFCYTPHKTLDFVRTMIQMAEEENYMGKADPIHAIEPKTMKRIVKAYADVYAEGPWLTKGDKMKLSRKRKSMY